MFNKAPQGSIKGLTNKKPSLPGQAKKTWDTSVKLPDVKASRPPLPVRRYIITPKRTVPDMAKRIRCKEPENIPKMPKVKKAKLVDPTEDIQNGLVTVGSTARTPYVAMVPVNYGCLIHREISPPSDDFVLSWTPSGKRVCYEVDEWEPSTPIPSELIRWMPRREIIEDIENYAGGDSVPLRIPRVSTPVPHKKREAELSAATDPILKATIILNPEFKLGDLPTRARKAEAVINSVVGFNEGLVSSVKWIPIPPTLLPFDKAVELYENNQLYLTYNMERRSMEDTMQDATLLENWFIQVNEPLPVDVGEHQGWYNSLKYKVEHGVTIHCDKRLEPYVSVDPTIITAVRTMFSATKIPKSVV